MKRILFRIVDLMEGGGEKLDFYKFALKMMQNNNLCQNYLCTENKEFKDKTSLLLPSFTTTIKSSIAEKAEILTN